MDVSMNVTATIARGASDEAGLTVLKKAMDVEAQGMMALVNALPQPIPSSANLPSHLGQHINVVA